MAVKNGFVAVDEHAIGLDRAKINHHGQIQLPQQPLRAGPDHSHEDGDEHEGKRSLRASISEKGHGAATKIKKKLHINKDHSTDIDGEFDREQSVLADPVTETSGSRLVDKLPVPDKKTVKDFLHSPVETTKTKLSGQGNQQVAANIAAKEISHGQEVDLLNAHDAIQDARPGEETDKATETFDQLMKERQNMYVRWTLDRHVTKLRVLPRTTFKRRPRSDFERKDAHGNGVLDWKAYGQHLAEYSAQQYGGQYIGYGMDHPTPSKESIMPNIERLIVASAPLQEFIMTSRRVYRWENRTETTKYLLIYFALWSTNLLLPGILSAVVYLVADRKFHAKTIEDMRNDLKRTEDRQRTALTLTEYIQKEGEELWADTILEHLGPWMMVQLADLANSFEVMRNFYEWRVPSRTMATLSIFIATILATAFVPAWLFIKVITLNLGITFFGLFPLAVNFPEYRLLASLPKRVFWNIPSHVDWSITSIQAEGSRYIQMHTPSPAPSDTPLRDYGTYPAHHNETKGRIVISNTGIRFAASNLPDTSFIFKLRYEDIGRLEKVDRVVGKQIPKLGHGKGRDLKIVEKEAVGKGEGDTEPREWLLSNVEMRDQVFSQIAGFSSVVWQVVW